MAVPNGHERILLKIVCYLEKGSRSRLNLSDLRGNYDGRAAENVSLGMKYDIFQVLWLLNEK